MDQYNYIFNALSFALAFALCVIFRCWYKSLEHLYKMRGLVYESESVLKELKNKRNIVSDWELERLKKTFNEMNDLIQHVQRVEWLRGEVSEVRKESARLREQVNFLMKMSHQSEGVE